MWEFVGPILSGVGALAGAFGSQGGGYEIDVKGTKKIQDHQRRMQEQLFDHTFPAQTGVSDRQRSEDWARFRENRDTQHLRDVEQIRAARQHQISQNQLDWDRSEYLRRNSFGDFISDARDAGIHPLAALGGGAPSYQPVTASPLSFSGGTSGGGATPGGGGPPGGSTGSFSGGGSRSTGAGSKVGAGLGKLGAIATELWSERSKAEIELMKSEAERNRAEGLDLVAGARERTAIQHMGNPPASAEPAKDLGSPDKMKAFTYWQMPDGTFVRGPSNQLFDSEQLGGYVSLKAGAATGNRFKDYNGELVRFDNVKPVKTTQTVKPTREVRRLPNSWDKMTTAERNKWLEKRGY